MKKFTIYYLLLFAVLFNLASCDKKDNDNPTPAASKQALLTAKTWKTNKITMGGVDMTKDPFIGALFLTITYKFNTDKTYTGTAIGLPTSGTWEFASNESVIVKDPGTDDEERMTITELKENSLKVSYVDPDDNAQMQLEFVH